MLVTCKKIYACFEEIAVHLHYKTKMLCVEIIIAYFKNHTNMCVNVTTKYDYKYILKQWKYHNITLCIEHGYFAETYL